MNQDKPFRIYKAITRLVSEDLLQKIVKPKLTVLDYKFQQNYFARGRLDTLTILLGTDALTMPDTTLLNNLGELIDIYICVNRGIYDMHTPTDALWWVISLTGDQEYIRLLFFLHQ